MTVAEKKDNTSSTVEPVHHSSTNTHPLTNTAQPATLRLRRDLHPINDKIRCEPIVILAAEDPGNCFQIEPLDLSIPKKADANNEGRENVPYHSRRFSYFGDFTEQDMENPILAKKFRLVAIKAIKEKDRIIKKFQARNRRFRERIKTLRTTMSSMLQQNSLSYHTACKLLIESFPIAARPMMERFLSLVSGYKQQKGDFPFDELKRFCSYIKNLFLHQKCPRCKKTVIAPKLDIQEQRLINNE